MKNLLGIIFLFSNSILYSQSSINPQFKGGDTTLMRFIATNMHYPEEAMEQNIQGTVFLSLFVDENGSISDIQVLRGLSGGCTEEAIRLINLTQGMWEPSTLDGKTVGKAIALPIKFTILDLSYSTQDDFFNIGMNLMKNGKYRQAIGFFPCSSSDDTLKVDALYNRGLCKFLLKEYPDAISDWEEAMKLRCQDCQAKINEAYKYIGDEFVEMKKYQKAIVYYTKYLDNLPQDIDMLIKRGEIYILIKKEEKACDDWYIAKDLGSTQAQILINEYCTK